jgi:hypothetical protein
VSGVVIVAPHDAAWARRAELMLVDAQLHVARAHYLGIIGYLLLAGGVRAVIVDQQCLGTGWPSLLDELRSLSPQTRVIIVGDPPLAAGDDVVAWPGDPAAALALLEATA